MEDEAHRNFYKQFDVLLRCAFAYDPPAQKEDDPAKYVISSLDGFCLLEFPYGGSRIRFSRFRERGSEPSPKKCNSYILSSSEFLISSYTIDYGGWDHVPYKPIHS